MDGELKRLLQNLQKPFSRAQRRAEQGLVRMGDEVVEPVAGVLFSESADTFTRSVAFRVLERIGTSQVIPHMLRLVREARDNDYAAARFLVRRRDPVLLASLLEIAGGADRHAAAAALTALGECEERRILPDLLGLVETRRDEAREDAIKAVGRLGGQEAFEALAPLLHDPDAYVRLTAAGALTTMQHPEAARRIALALRTESVEASIKLMAEYLIDLNAADSLPTILDALKRLKNKSALHTPLAWLKGGIPADVAPYLKDSSADIRIAAVIVLGNSGRIEAVAPLLAARTDADYWVRLEVRKALKLLRRAGVSFSMPSVRIRDRAASALQLLAVYFQIPSSEGFSAYRTGWITHVAFSAIVAAGIDTMASSKLGLAFVPAAALALVGVMLLWGVGVLVGILSHYNPLIMIGAIVAIIAGLLLSPSMALGLLIAAAGHCLMTPFAVILKRVREALI